MDKDQFVKYIHSIGTMVKDGCAKELRDPPGRQPYASDRQRSKWFLSLSAEDQATVEEVIRVAVQATIFSLLCELDGVGGVAGTAENGMLELRYLERGTVTLINDPKQEELHEIYPSMIEW